MAAIALQAAGAIVRAQPPDALPSHAASLQPQTVTLLDYHAAVPGAWTSRAPASNMRLAEYVAGAPGGAEVIVYYFGPSQGGTVEANLARWKSQLTNPDGSAVVEKTSHEKAGAIPRGALFFQLFGPAAAVEAQRAAYLAFVRSLK